MVFWRLTVFVGILAGSIGCGESLPAPDVVAQVDQRLVRYQDFERYLGPVVGDGAESLGSDVLSGLLDQYVMEICVRRYAEARGLAGKLDSGQALERAIVDERITDGVSVADVRAYYESHQTEFERPERVRLRQILVKEQKQAQTFYARLIDGESFEVVLREIEGDSQTSINGDQGVLAREDLPPAFADLIFDLKVGEFSDPVAADYGFHIFQVVERFPATQLDLRQASGQIREGLHLQLISALREELVRDLQDRYNAKVFARNLPFNYNGRYAAGGST